MKNILIKSISISALTSTFLLGETPNIGDIEKQIQVPKEVEKQQQELIDIGGVKKYAPPMTDDKSGKTIFVKSFKIDGAIRISEAKLQNLISSYNEKELTFKQLQEVAAIITKEYRKQGYFVARAYLPVQDINKNSGVIIIAIIEGNYGEFKLNNNSNVKDSIIQGMLDDAKRDNIVSTHTLERSMLIINDTPGAIVTGANVMPGKSVGTSDFAITTKAAPLYDGYLIGDNYGSKYTGKNRIMAGLNLNSIMGYGDKISFSGLVSNGTDLKNGRIAYSAPLSYSGLRGELSYSHTEYSLVDLEGTPDDIFTGKSKTLEGKLTYPVIRTRIENLYTNLIIGKKDLNDKYEEDDLKPRDAKYLKAGLEYSKDYLAFGKNNKSAIEFTYTYGKLSFDNKSDKSDDELAANTNGNYSKINLDLSHNISLTKELSLETNLKTQYALNNKNLDGSEDISIGGSNGVKLYPSGELSAENGYIFNIEAKYSLPILYGISNTIGVFYDRGKAFMADNTVEFESKSLQDIGIGLYTNYKTMFSKLQVAWDANSKNVTAEKPDRQSKVLFQAGMVF